ncbi:hypothetical protein BDV25DRAFT_141212 [Aspergillus avenaceus]|uniref:DUF4139 domain-containing protein n=1 Tax=Aspergillus avenaceus TaxID=36643 RepID=A0A5N6TRK9_ASPAV|nr:hypothetical protein BDV25DRAFT_141212 [Aspergillus avenaceus]
MAEISTSEVEISDLPTKSVTITPQRATVTREIRASIQQGQHELKILGLDPRVDVDSIRVEGTGEASITDIQTMLVPRREHFEDVHVLALDDGEGESSDSEPDGEIGEIEAEVAELDAKLARANNEQAMAVRMLEFLDDYALKLEPESVGLEKFDGFLQLYARERAAGAEKHHAALVVVKEVEEGKKRLAERRKRVSARREKEKEGVRRERERRTRERQRKNELERNKWHEKKAFWTQLVGQVVVHLDTLTSVEASDDVEGGRAVDVVLCLSYVVPGAGWSSCYDLRINTPASSAQMVYRAEFRNSSAETWTDACVTLSTSQGSFSGLGEQIPSLHPWYVKVLDAVRDEKNHPSWENILDGGHAKRKPTFGTQSHPASKPAFGSSGGFKALAAMDARPSPFGNPFAAPRPPSFGQATGSLFGAPAAPAPSFGKATGSPFGAPAGPAAAHQAPDEGSASMEEAEEDDIDAQTIASTTLEHKESVKQDYGLTTTYDLPGRRTLAPSSNNRRHVLADLNLRSVTLSHMIVPKHRAAAFFRARIKNTSALNILRGKAGITVDGTFLGTVTTPGCAPEGFFNLSLGIDPSILVRYSKPIVRRATSGFFTKEVGATFRRTCWVKNTKSTAADITVVEQVPLSENEKFQVQIVEPKGLDKEGDEATLEMDTSSGKGTASLENNGEVKWVIHLEAGKDVKVIFEYATTVPSGCEVDMA